MTRPLRIEFSGALYHVTARGDRRNSIYRSDSDRMTWLSILGETCNRFNFVVRAYCQMTNHYHLLVETVDGGLACGMRYLNGHYSQYFNRTHKLVGHVFQGRYKAILCQREGYLQMLTRYIELNPVRANIVVLPSEWLWSSYRTTMGQQDTPVWLQPNLMLMHFSSDPQAARQAYQQFVLEGINEPSPLSAVKNQLLLGNDAFCASVVNADVAGDHLEIKRAQRKAMVRPLDDYFAQYRDPKEAMVHAYLSLGYSMPEIAHHARVSVKTVSRAVHAYQIENLRPREISKVHAPCPNDRADPDLTIRY